MVLELINAFVETLDSNFENVVCMQYYNNNQKILKRKVRNTS